MSVSSAFTRGRAAEGYPRAIARLGEQLQEHTQLNGVVHINRPEQVDLLRELRWDGVNRFAKCYGMDVKCRARGTVFDFMPRAAPYSK